MGRLDPSTTAEAVTSHVDWLLGETGKVTTVEIPHCFQAYGYRGYKVSVPAARVTEVLLPDKWPAHVSVKKFYQTRGDRNAGKNEHTQIYSQRPKRSASLGQVAG